MTCTNLESGAPEYIRLQDMNAEIDYMRASASMSYVSRIVEIGGKKLLDGGCSDSIPVRKALEMGLEKTVVVLTRPADYRKNREKSSLAPIFYHKYPNFIQTLRNRAESYNRSVEDVQQLERESKIFVIRPRTPLEIGRMSHDPEQIYHAYLRGCEDAAESLQALLRWMEKT